MVKVVGKSSHRCLHLLHDCLVGIGVFPGYGHHTAIVFMHEHHSAVDEIAENCHKLIIIAGLEIFPSEIVIFCLGSVGSEHVAKHVLLAGKLAEIFMEPYSPVARCGDLVVFQIQELIRRHIIRQVIAAVCHKHGGEDDAVEHYIILADEVEHACLGSFHHFSHPSGSASMVLEI